jgi:hypothetical protein
MAELRGHGQKLSRHGEHVLAALLQHPTIAEASSASGISERTVFRWLQRDDFQKRYREARRAVVDDAISELQAATKEAVATLRRNLSCGNAFAENTAAQAILAQSLKAIEQGELVERIERLEERLEEKLNEQQAKGKVYGVR